MTLEQEVHVGSPLGPLELGEVSGHLQDTGTHDVFLLAVSSHL